MGKNTYRSKTEKENMKYCRKCGSKILEDSKFCAECGAKLEFENNSRLTTGRDNLTLKRKSTHASRLDIVDVSRPRSSLGKNVVGNKYISKCPRCNNENCQIINEVKTEGKDFSASKGCLGALLLGPLGILCGACGKGKQTTTTNYWVCNKCGYKWKA